MVLTFPGGLFGQRDVRETPTTAFTAAEAVPIGAVLPFLKTLPNCPAMPTGYLECDGSVVNDADSVFNGVTLPDLNGDNRLLRGNSTSGIEQTQSLSLVQAGSSIGGKANPDSSISVGTVAGYALSTEPGVGTSTWNTNTEDVEGISTTNYTVVWIIRVK